MPRGDPPPLLEARGLGVYTWTAVNVGGLNRWASQKSPPRVEHSFSNRDPRYTCQAVDPQLGDDEDREA